jgi:hypothetical protein
MIAPLKPAAKIANRIIRITVSIVFAGTLEGIGDGEKNAGALLTELCAGCCRAALDPARASRHVREQSLDGGFPMRDLISSWKKAVLAAAVGAVLGLMTLAPGAQAANLFELNFGLFGPSYDGRVANCEAGLSTISSQFQDKESTFWNSALQIAGFSKVHETAFRPWQSDNIPRRYCTADAMLTDGKLRQVHYSIIEDGGFAGYGQGVEWCVVGLDRDWAYNPRCRAAKQ